MKWSEVKTPTDCEEYDFRGCNALYLGESPTLRLNVRKKLAERAGDNLYWPSLSAGGDVFLRNVGRYNSEDRNLEIVRN
jgi:hypothetical protein